MNNQNLLNRTSQPRMHAGSTAPVADNPDKAKDEACLKLKDKFILNVKNADPAEALIIINSFTAAIDTAMSSSTFQPQPPVTQEQSKVDSSVVQSVINFLNCPDIKCLLEKDSKLFHGELTTGNKYPPKLKEFIEYISKYVGHQREAIETLEGSQPLKRSQNEVTINAYDGSKVHQTSVQNIAQEGTQPLEAYLNHWINSQYTNVNSENEISESRESLNQMSRVTYDKMRNKILNCAIKKNRVLDLSYLGLSNLPDLTDYPLSFHHVEILLLPRNTLTIFPKSFLQNFKNLKSLNLDMNSIKEFTQDSLDGLNNLEYLSLSQNDLHDLPKDVFMNTPKLKNLEISHNSLETLPAGCFNGLGKLKSLELHNNELTSLPPGLLNRMPKLRELTLGNNHLETLPEECFNCLGELKTLELCNNELKSLPPGLFNSMPKLRELTLGNNNLETLPEECFNGLGELKTLELCNNELTSLPPGLLNRMPKLRELTLGNNNLETLPEECFNGLGELKTLDLCNNELTSLPVRLLNRMPKLQVLNLSGNQIRILCIEHFINQSNLVEIDLSDNPIEQIAPGVFDSLPESCDIICPQQKELEFLLFSEHLEYLLKLGGDDYKLQYPWDADQGVGSLQIFFRRIPEIASLMRGSSEEERQTVYKSIAQIIHLADHNNEYRDCIIAIATSTISDCGDAIHFGFILMTLALGSTEHNSVSSIFDNLQKHLVLKKTLDYASQWFLSNGLSNNKLSKNEALEACLTVINDPSISKKYNLPITHMQHEGFVIKAIFHEIPDTPEKPGYYPNFTRFKEQVIDWTTSYCNNANNIFEAMLDHHGIRAKYGKELDEINKNITKKCSSEELTLPITYDNIKNEQIEFLKTKHEEDKAKATLQLNKSNNK